MPRRAQRIEGGKWPESETDLSRCPCPLGNARLVGEETEQVSRADHKLRLGSNSRAIADFLPRFHWCRCSGSCGNGSWSDSRSGPRRFVRGRSCSRCSRRGYKVLPMGVNDRFGEGLEEFGEVGGELFLYLSVEILFRRCAWCVLGRS